MLQTGAVQDLALQELEEGRAAFALGGDGEQRVPVVAVGELPARAARQRQDGLLCLVDVGNPFSGIGRAGQSRSVREQLVDRHVADPIVEAELSQFLQPQDQHGGEALGDRGHPEGSLRRLAVPSFDQGAAFALDAHHSAKVHRRGSVVDDRDRTSRDQRDEHANELAHIAPTEPGLAALRCRPEASSPRPEAYVPFFSSVRINFAIALSVS